MGKHIKQKKRYLLHGRNLYHSPRLAVYHRVAVIKKKQFIALYFIIRIILYFVTGIYSFISR